MLQFLFDFWDWLSGIVTSLLDFFKSTIHGLGLMIKMFPKILNLTTSSIAYLPSIFATFITVTIIIYIVYLIIGRNAGGSD